MVGSSSSSRTARIFLSSTFRDFGEERDLLVRKVFPALRARLQDRFVELVDVDLRWGITAEQAERGEVLPICLAEIDRSRPFFVGLLGERYGWIPPADRYPPPVLESQPWLQVHRGGKSVTELEILHGVLNDPTMAGRALFYFRSAAYAERKGGDYVPASPEDAQRQTDLKSRIRASGFPVVEDYADPVALAERLEADLWAVLDETFPAAAVPDAFTREGMRHEAYAAPRRGLYLGGEAYLQALDEALAAGRQWILIAGQSGGGKSALLANWVGALDQRHQNHLPHVHYLGATADASEPVALVRRLIEFMQRTVGNEEALPSDPDDLLESLPGWLGQASAWGERAGKRLVIVIDALNGLTERRDLRWFPSFLPERVQVVVSCLPGEVLDHLLGKAAWTEVTVEPLDRGKAEALFVTYLRRFNKALPAAMLAQVLQHPLVVNPLFLRTLAEELRLFGVHEALQARLDHYLESRTVDDLFERVLARVEQDNDAAAVGRAMVGVWASRSGLTEEEVQGVAGMTPVEWASVRHALGNALVESAGRWVFGHDYLRIAVSDRYLLGNNRLEAEGQSEGALARRREAHATLARWLEGHAFGTADKREESRFAVSDARAAAEVPWQWQAAEAWDALATALTRREMFEALEVHRSREEHLGYWLALEAATGARLEEAYASAWQHWAPEEGAEATGELAATLSGFLRYAGRYRHPLARELAEAALAIAEKVLGAEHSVASERLHALGTLFQILGNYVSAESLYRRALAVAERAQNPTEIDVGYCLHGLAWLLKETGDYAAAEPLYRRALAIAERTLGLEHPEVGIRLNNLALLLDAQGKYDQAEPLYRRALAIAEKAQGPEHPDTGCSLNNLAELLRAQGDYAQAEPLYRRALAIAEKALGPEHPETGISLNNLAALLQNQGDYAQAEALYRRALAITEKALGPEHPTTGMSLNNLAELLRDMGDYAQAEPLYRRALAIVEMALGLEHPDTGISLNNLAALLQNRGDYAQAEPLHRRALAITEKALGPEHPETGARCWALGNCLAELGRTEEAVQFLARELTITQAVEGADSDSAARTHQRLGVILRDAGRWDVALPHLEAALRVFESLSGRQSDDMAGVLNALGQLAALQGDYPAALEKFTEALAIRRTVSPENNEGISLLEARIAAAREQRAND